MSDKFYPVRGKVVLKRNVKSGVSDAGVVYTPREHQKYLIGMVSSIGEPTVLPNGKELEPEYKVGDYVMYDYSRGMEGFGGFDLVMQDQVIAVVDKDTEIS